MTRDKKFKKTVRERMKRTGESYVTARASLMPRCVPDKPCPPDADPMKWIHDYETTYEGAMWTTLRCKNCGHEVKAAPRD